MPELTPSAEAALRRFFHSFNRLMLLMWRLGLGPSLSLWPDVGGRIMVLGHIGRKSGLRRRTPLNYASEGGSVYIVAGFGAISDWYKNIGANPAVELWLPEGCYVGRAAELPADDPERMRLLRAVLRASGIVAPLVGVDPWRLSDAELAAATTQYRLIRITRAAALTGADGPGDLAWVWPAAGALILAALLARRLLRR